MSSNKDKPLIAIEAVKDGPFIVKGLTELIDSTGNEVPLKKSVIALCRCGGSTNKPFCDGTHSGIGFSGERQISKPLNRERGYVGKHVTIHDNRVICAHAGECIKNLPQVFRKTDRPWIDPDSATVEEVIKAVNKCPSGALSYSVEGVHYDVKGDIIPCIKIAKDGPYHASGHIELKNDDELQSPNKTSYTLCRCGASKNKPFCDGSHHEIGFKDEKS
jgi:CDGSH-type Zn-finger protein